MRTGSSGILRVCRRLERRAPLSDAHGNIYQKTAWNEISLCRANRGNRRHGYCSREADRAAAAELQPMPLALQPDARPAGEEADMAGLEPAPVRVEKQLPSPPCLLSPGPEGPSRKSA